MVISMATTTSPQHENRVQNIKKQFEVNKQRPPNLVITKDQEPIARTLVNSTLYTEVNKKRGKHSPGIKRSPAFRCDKIVRGGGVKPSSVVNKVKLFEDSVSETNYLEPYDRKVYRSAENITENLRNQDQDLCRSQQDLSKPLPPGPPPKKPPRTFAHTPEQPEKSVISNNKNGLIRNGAVKCSNKPVISNLKPVIQNYKPIIQNSKPGLQKGHSYAAILKSPPKIQNGIKPAINSTKPTINGTKPTVKPMLNGNKPTVNSNKPMVNGSRTVKSAGNSTLNSSKSMMNGSQKRRPREPPPKMPPRSKTESHLQYKPQNKPDLSARALLTSCIPMCNSSAAQYEALPQKLTAREISAPVPIPRSQSEEHIYAEPFNKDPSAGVPVKFQPTPLLLTRTGTNGLYYMSTPIEGPGVPWSGWPHPRPTHLPLCSSFSTPSLRTIPHSPPTNYGRPSMSPPSISPPQKPRISPQRPVPAQRTFVDSRLTPSPAPRLTPPPENGTSPPQRVQRPTEAPPQKPQRSGAIARLAAKVATGGGQRSNEEIDENKIQVLMNRAFSGLQLSPDSEANSSNNSDSGADSSSMLDSPVEGGFVLVPPPALPSPAPSEEEDCSEEETRKLVERRKGYIRRTSSVAFNTARRQAFRRNSGQPQRLFHALVLVGLRYDAETHQYVPYIKSAFPENAEIPTGMEMFVFPDVESWPPTTEVEEHRSYTLVFTEQSGDRLFAFCRRVLPEGATNCIPLAYCILTSHRATGFYHKLLEEVESRHGQSESSRLTFLSQLHACTLPTPGQSLMLPGLTISRPPDPRLEENELAQAFDCLHHNLLIKLLASLLHERKLVLVSQSLSKVTSCVMALQSALYPFSWQHTLVSALPFSMLQLCEAPTPYLFGVLRQPDQPSPVTSVDEGMVVDLDQGRVLHCMDDEEKILPVKLRKALRLAMQLVESSTRPNEPPRNVLVSEAFVRTFVEVCGHYRTHIVTQQDGKRVFERESFIKGAYPRCIQTFLEWFTETSMFSHFIESRLQSATQGIFERRCCERMQEMEKSTLMFLKNYKVVSRKGKTFGDRIKDWSSNF